MSLLLVLIGVICMAVAILHGVAGHRLIIARSEFPNPVAKGFASVIWQYSTVTWFLAGVFIAVATSLLSPEQIRWAVPLACLPLAYGAIGNLIVSRGRHYGWIALGSIAVSASIAANIQTW